MLTKPYAETKNIILKRGMSTVKEETKTRITRYVQ